MKRIILGILIAFSKHLAYGHGPEPLLNAALLKTPSPPPVVVPAVSETLKTCFDGYTLSPAGDECAKIIDEPAWLVCSDGSLVEGVCQITAPYLTQCPLGYAPDGEACSRSWEVPLTFYCAKGFYDDGESCAREELGTVVTECDVGDLVGDNCILRREAPYELSSKCPDGSQVEEDGNCWKILETFDCNEAELQTRVISSVPETVPVLGKEVSMPILTKSHSNFRHLGHKKHKAVAVEEEIEAEIIEIPCPMKEMVTVSAPQPLKIDIASQLCYKKIFVDALLVTTCPIGYVDIDGVKCLQETLSFPRVTCLTNGRSDGPCPPIVHHVPKRPGCPIGSTKLDGHCMETDTVPPEQLCARGFDDTGDVCVGVVESPGYECPSGLELEGDRCTGISIRPPVEMLLEPDVPMKY